ncbi:hypothetical protein BLNAU_8202 [Blattamonas nauphoetae]|uniref:Uncharacterized protein n=1 Tax=Blattamonas nauphoetae TaxID=2049346 RepID=A0ABQ9XZ66_9EUKA|nr:hypothetical protein BLNAU_8202 [Blattamonas nauphoetae]
MSVIVTLMVSIGMMDIFSHLLTIILCGSVLLSHRLAPQRKNSSGVLPLPPSHRTHSYISLPTPSSIRKDPHILLPLKLHPRQFYHQSFFQHAAAPFKTPLRMDKPSKQPCILENNDTFPSCRANDATAFDPDNSLQEYASYTLQIFLSLLLSIHTHHFLFSRSSFDPSVLDLSCGGRFPMLNAIDKENMFAFDGRTCRPKPTEIGTPGPESYFGEKMPPTSDSGLSSAEKEIVGGVWESIVTSGTMTLPRIDGTIVNVAISKLENDFPEVVISFNADVERWTIT